MNDPENIDKIASAFEGLVTEDCNIATFVRDNLPTGIVNLTAEEVEAIANRIHELQAIVAQNALVRGDVIPQPNIHGGWPE